MNISVNWLRELAPGIEGEPAALAERLSMRAVAVDAVEPLGEGLGDILVARVLEAKPHPNADRLTLCRVDAGAEPIDVVCGAPDVRPGTLYPFVPPGGVLPNGLEIESRKIRGETSHGMLCSEAELGLGRDAGGILALDPGLTPGQRLIDALSLPDARLVLDLTPNRVDLACHIGVARELAPDGVAGVQPREFGAVSWDPAWVEDTGAGITVTVEDLERCPRYLAAVIRGVRVGPSPAWLASRLRATGSRPINNVVDATNYVLLERNQPLHAFDLARLEGAEIRVRAARAGERLRTLDGNEHALAPAATVIADRERPVALAGVMGGEDAEVTGSTKDLLIECALFDARHTRRTARVVEKATDASYRFERGVDPAGLEAALCRCVELIVAVAGGDAVGEAVRCGQPAPAPMQVPLRPAAVRRVLGVALDAREIAGLLRPLGFGIDDEDGARDPAPAAAGSAPTSAGVAEGEALCVRVPGWRGDVTRPVDLIEEVARRHGYDAFPEEPRRFRPSSVPDDPVWDRERRVRRLLVGRGCLEARSASFVPEALAGADGVHLPHPLSAAEGSLRGALVPVLLRRLEHNFARGRRDVRLFEIGTVFARRPGAGGDASPGNAPATSAGVADIRAAASAGRVPHPFAEERRVAVLLTGARRPPHWSEETRDVDVWELKGITEDLAESLGIGMVEPAAGPALVGASGPAAAGAPGPAAGGEVARAPIDVTLPLGAEGWLEATSFRIVGDGGTAGVAGRVTAESMDAPPWAAPVWAIEFRLAAVAPAPVSVYRPVPAFPAVLRDLAFTLRASVPAAAVRAAIEDGAPAILESARLFDVYSGEGIEASRRSLAWRLRFRAPDRTLRMKEVDRAMKAIISVLEERFDVSVRSS